MELTKKVAVNLTTLQGSRQWGPVVSNPHIIFGPRLVHTSNIEFKNVLPSMWFLPPLLRHPGDKNTNIMLTEMLEIVLTPKILGPPKSGALGLTLFSLMINPRLHIVGQCLI